MQQTSYEMRISDWSSDVCSSDLASFGHIDGFALKQSLTRLSQIGSVGEIDKPVDKSLRQMRFRPVEVNDAFGQSKSRETVGVTNENRFQFRDGFLADHVPGCFTIHHISFHWFHLAPRLQRDIDSRCNSTNDV